MANNTFDETKQKLDDISSSFCAAKWKQVTIHLEAGTTHSCHHPKVHKIPLDEIKSNPSALHNTQFKKEQRKKMLEGVRPSECDYCWRIEDLEGENKSDRYAKSNANWSRPYIDTIASMPWDDNVAPSYLEVSFSNVCNFKCSYCSPSFSSKWMEEIKLHGVYPTGQYDLDHLDTENGLPIPVREHNPYIEAFWKWWPEVYPELEVFRITGGEPLLSKDTFRILDYFISNPHPDLSFAVNTNLGIPDDLLDTFIEKIKIITDNNLVKDVTVFTSVEGYGDRAAYIRHGMVFDKFMNNVERILNETSCSLTFMCAFNALSVTSFTEFLEKIYSLKQQYADSIGRYKNDRYKRILVDIPYLRYPTHQAVQILPSSYLKYIEESIAYLESNKRRQSTRPQGFLPHEIDHMKRIHNLMSAPVENTTKIDSDRADFYRFFIEHDKRRGTDFLTTFPEMKDFWELAKAEAEAKAEKNQK